MTARRSRVRLPARVEDGERLRIGGAQRHACRGRRAGPDDAARRLAELRVACCRLERVASEQLAVALVDRRLVRCRTHMAGEDARIRVVEDRSLHAPPEELVGLAHEVLVERILGRDEHGEPVSAPSRPAPLLAERGHRAREADGDHRIEQADVDPKLERIGGRHAEQVTLRDRRSISRRCAVYPARYGERCVSSPTARR